jgi:hypothetical protein
MARQWYQGTEGLQHQLYLVHEAAARPGGAGVELLRQHRGIPRPARRQKILYRPLGIVQRSARLLRRPVAPE